MNQAITQQLLDQVSVGALATVDATGGPLVAPLHFVRVGDNIVWISDRGSRHSQSIDRQETIEFVVWDEQKRAVFIRTVAGEITDQSAQATAHQAYRAKFGEFVPRCDDPALYTAPIGRLDDDSTTENWLRYVA